MTQPSTVFQSNQIISHGKRARSHHYEKNTLWQCIKYNENEPKSPTLNVSDLLEASANFLSSHGCSQCPQTGSGYWNSCPHSHILSLPLDLPMRSTAKATKSSCYDHFTDHQKIRINSMMLYLRSRVHHVYISAVVIGFANGLKHVLVFQTASAEAGKRLTAPTYRCLENSHKTYRNFQQFGEQYKSRL